ncbi:hypothetical protein PI124_g14672 [Phytophthora idaei]|nr:hypothetical protein PI125_g20345 [Phytophthora idaei]KAG3240425.1 hypothetical protein PI124_g14672 [Phytophthora idaei]
MRVYSLLAAAAAVVTPLWLVSARIRELLITLPRPPAPASRRPQAVPRRPRRCPPSDTTSTRTSDLPGCRLATSVSSRPNGPILKTAINTGNLADADVGYKTSEDCLYLGVWAPADAVGRNLPVMVWTYGGGFTGGSKSGVTPEGLFDLSTDFVYVAYNYRVGITGLANGPTYQHEGGVANLCVWDSEHAFEWVQKCISSFGGNPNDVTAVGFSAGGSQVMFQMTRFGGRAPQLFHKAYIMSPGYVPGAGHHHAEQFWQNVSSSLGCDGGHLDCMREVAYDSLANASNTTVDSYTYQMQPAWTASSSRTRISDDAVETLLELYPEENYESAGLRFADMKQSFDLTDKNIALTHALNNQTWNAEVALGDATHGADQNYYWYSTYTLNTSSNSSSDTETLSAAEAAGVGAVTTTVNATIAVAMQKYLVSFVLTGNPNSIWPEDNIYWPMFNESSVGTQVVFNDMFTVAGDDLASAQSTFCNKALWY